MSPKRKKITWNIFLMWMAILFLSGSLVVTKNANLCSAIPAKVKTFILKT